MISWWKKEKFIREEGEEMELVIAIAIMFIFPFFLHRWFQKFGLPEIPEEFGDRNKIVICSCRNYDVGLGLMLCLEMAVFLLCGFVALLLDLQIAPAVMLLFFSGVFGAMTAIFILFMKNRMLIFCPKGIVHKTTLGKIYYYPDDSIKGYYCVYSAKNKSICIKTKDRTVSLNQYCTNFQEVKKVVQKYPYVG